MSKPTERRYSKGRWMIERERCRIADFIAPPRDNEGVVMAAGVQDMLTRMGLSHAAWAAEIAENWASIVGANVAKHTRPGVLQGNELSVFVDSSVWLSELQRYGLPVLLKNVQAYAGEGKVKRVRLQLDPDKKR